MLGNAFTSNRHAPGIATAPQRPSRAAALLYPLLATCCITGIAYGDGCCVQGTCVTATSAECAAMGGTYYAFECPSNGYCPEPAPRAGEQRFNRFQYHATHNSFQRGSLSQVTLTEQVDAWGATQIELDIWWDNGQFYVLHNCPDAAGQGFLDTFLADLDDSRALRHSFIVLDLQMWPVPADAGSLGDCMDPMPSDWRDQLEAKLTAYLGAFQGGAEFYTASDFGFDQEAWPSYQELLRRDKHVMAILNYDVLEDGFFFKKGGPPSSHAAAVEINSGMTEHAWDLGDKWISRHYPSGAITCPVESYDDWSEAIENGFTFAATNCEDDLDRITNSRLHPPVPMYVNTFSNESEYIGTWGRPYPGATGLGLALQRLSLHEESKGQSNVEISIGAGTYVLTDAVTGELSMRCTLTARGGVVTLE